MSKYLDTRDLYKRQHPPDSEHLIPVICSSHISLADWKVMRCDEINVMHFTDRECGPVLQWDDGMPSDDIPDEFEDYSPEFHALVRAFNDLGYHYIRLDGMAETVPGLPTFDW